jgi:hypothetical protein
MEIILPSAVNDLVLWWGTFIYLCFIPEFILHHLSYFISLWACLVSKKICKIF